MDQFGSMDELASYEVELAELSAWAKLDASDVVSAIHYRMDEIEELASPATKVQVEPKISSSTAEFSDFEIGNLFEGLTDYYSD